VLLGVIVLVPRPAMALLISFNRKTGLDMSEPLRFVGWQRFAGCSAIGLSSRCYRHHPPCI